MGEVRRSTIAAVRERPLVPATAIFALLVLALLWRALLGGEILSPIADLYGVVPWQHAPPPDLHSYWNPELADLPLVDYPWRFLVRQLIRDGTFPAWNPYVLGGIPLYSNPQTGLFSPFNLPLWLLPLTYGLGVSAALKLLAAAVGTYLLARQLRLRFLPAVLAGIAFAFAAINVVWLSHETLPGVIAMLPWAIWLIERLFARPRAREALWLTVAIAVGIGGGHPGMQVHLLLVAALYAVVRAAVTARTERRHVVRALVLVGGALAAGTLLMAFMLIPELRSADGTVGVLARRAGSLPGDHMPLAAIRTVLFPDWWGRPSGIERGEGIAIPVNYNERTFYPGAVALLLAGVGLLAPGGWRRKAPFALLGALGLAVALDAPGLEWLMRHAPVVDAVQAQRLHFAFAFAVALLAGFGLQALLDAPTERRRLAIPAAAAVVVALALAHAGARAGDFERTLRHFVGGVDFPREGVLALTSIAWFLLFALGVTAALLLARARPRWRTAIAAAVVLLAAADAYHFAHGYNPIAPAAKAIPPATPAIAYLTRHRDEGRIVGVQSSLPNDWPLVYGLRDVRGYDPPQPTRRMLALWRLANPQQLPWASFTLDAVTPAASRVLDVLGVRYAVASPDVVLGAGLPPELRVIYRGDDATLIANARAAPRALVAGRIVATSGEAGTLHALLEPRFDARSTVAVERSQPGVAAFAADAHPRVTAGERVAIARERDASVTLRADLARRRLVVLDDALLPGWTVRVDGRPAPALRVDDVLRGVIVPPGRHEVAWSYEVPGLRAGVIVSLATLAALAAAALALRARRRRGAVGAPGRARRRAVSV